MINNAGIRDLLIREKEKKFNRNNSFYTCDSQGICRRDSLIQWVVAQSSQFNHQIKTLELAVICIDTYLNYFSITQYYLQLLCISAYSIASKYNEIEIMSQIKLYDSSGQPLYQDEEYDEMEEQILKSMDYQLNHITPSDYLVEMKIEMNENIKNLMMFILLDFEIYQHPHIQLALAIIAFQNESQYEFTDKILLLSELIHTKLTKAQELQLEKSEQEETKSVDRSPQINKKISKKKESQKQRIVRSQN